MTHPLAPHYCHALQCMIEVDPDRLMCPKHWRMVPRDAQRDVWKHYVRGQEVTKTPTTEYLKAATHAINIVARREGRIP